MMQTACDNWCGGRGDGAGAVAVEKLLLLLLLLLFLLLLLVKILVNCLSQLRSSGEQAYCPTPRSMLPIAHGLLDEGHVVSFLAHDETVRKIECPGCCTA